MKKVLLPVMAALLAMSSVFIGCTKSTPEKPPVDATGISSTLKSDTVFIDYGKTINLATLFSINPADAVGTLAFSLVNQPEFVEGSGTVYTPVDAYILADSMLVSAQRVPDVVTSADNSRMRFVRQGKLKVSVTGGATVTPRELTIIQTNKPALPPPTITLKNVAQIYGVNVTDGPNGKLITLGTSKQWKTFSSSLFNVTPIDYDPNTVLVRPSPNATYIFEPNKLASGETTSNSSIFTRAAGDFTNYGTGQYVIAFYANTQGLKDTTTATRNAAIAAAYANAITLPVTSPQVARLYVDVNYVAATTIVGIRVHPNIGEGWNQGDLTITPPSGHTGHGGRTVFVRDSATGDPNGTPSLYNQLTARSLQINNFVQAVLNDGTFADYVINDYGDLGCNFFTTGMTGVTARLSPYDGWWANVSQPAQMFKVGDTVTFTVTRLGNIATQPPIGTFLQPEFTVQVKTVVKFPKY